MAQTKNILLVEDNSSVACVLEYALTSLDQTIRVHCVQSGEEAHAVLDSQDWDLVVADYALPGISGLELVKRVKANLPESIPWIFISAFGSQAVQQKIEALGIRHYLTKPFSIETFRRTVAASLAFNQRALLSG